MKKTVIALISLSFIFTGAQVQADFDLKGELNITPPKGEKQNKVLSIGYTAKEYDHTFAIGDKTYSVSGRPEKYSFAIVLQKNNYVWIQEFSDKPIKSFDWSIGEKKIRLYKKVLGKPVMGDYILSVDEKDYFFSKNIAQLTFIFGEEGITEIEIDGMVASLGLNKAKTECPKELAEGEELPDGCEAP